MLSRVLLQHLQTLRPMNHSCYRLSNRERHVIFQVMQYTAILSHGNGRHRHRIDYSSIVWLPAATRVEGRLIEHHHLVAILDKTIHDLRGKLGAMGIVPVKFCGHSIMHQGCRFPLQSHVRVAPDMYNPELLGNLLAASPITSKFRMTAS
jgi:hypothetical protein